MIPEIVERDVSLVTSDASVQAATWGLARIQADKRGSVGLGVTIYILDTGMRVTHTEFGDRAKTYMDCTWGGTLCNGAVDCAADRNGHGTHCGGTAGGENVGVATKASLEAIKVLTDQ